MPDRGSTAYLRIGGVLNYGYATPGSLPVADCFFCPALRKLAFPPGTIPGVPGYVMPGSMLVQVDGRNVFVPIPFTALLVPDAHYVTDPGGFGLTFPPGWGRFVRQLVTIIPGFDPGCDWSLHSQIGRAAGARPPEAIVKAGKPAHAFNWVVWCRDVLDEGWIPSAKDLGLATIILLARQSAGSLPANEELARLWLEALGQVSVEPLIYYQRKLLELAA